MDRYPAVAGQFYPAREDELRRTVEELIPDDLKRVAAIGAVAPHAGYVYSGAIAGKVFGSLKPVERVIVLGPNHHGYGHAAAVYPEGDWHTPLGTVGVDERLADEILRSCPGAGADTQAHRLEHSLEVMLPFLQVSMPEARIVPICLGHLPLKDLIVIGETLGTVLANQQKSTLLLASSDMTHYEAGAVAREKDRQALERVCDLDPEGLYRTVRRQQITMCGVVPVVVMLAAAKFLGARQARLIDYGNSGDVTGDQTQVVGYAAVTIS